MSLKFTSVRENEPFWPPSRQHSGDAGFDLSVSRYVQVYPGQNAHLSTNIAVEIPEGLFGLILPRSSTLYHKGLHVSPGVVDAGYRGEVMILVRNITDRAISVNEGDRVAQMLIIEAPQPGAKFTQVPSLSKGERGDAGFGSTGG